MIIIYSKPNTLSIPYNTTRIVELRDKDNKPVFDEKGNIKKIEKNFPEYFRFIPGKNTISEELWLKIVEYNEKQWDYYSTILKVFKPKGIDKNTNAQIGEDEDVIEKNIKELSPFEMKELIENTMDANDLSRYLKEEKERDKPRPSIMKAIKERKAKIDLADEVLLNKGGNK